jgi:hypothetical protein
MLLLRQYEREGGGWGFFNYFSYELSRLLPNESIDVVIEYHESLEKTTVVQLWV